MAPVVPEAPVAPATSATSATSAAAPEPLALDAAVSAAFAQNRDFLDARAAVLRARLGSVIATSDVYAPRLQATYTNTNTSNDTGSAEVGVGVKSLGFDIRPYLRTDLDRDGTTSPAGNQVPRTTSAVGLSLSRRVFNISEHLRQRLPVTRAEQALFGAANTLVIRARRLELDTARAFLAVQNSEARLAVRVRRVADAEAFLASVRQRVDHGFAAPLDGLNAEIDLNQAQADLLAERTGLTAARQDLNILLGRAVMVPVVIVPEAVGPERMATLTEPAIEADATRVLAGNEDLGTQARAIDLAIEELRVARDQLVPQVTATIKAEERTVAPGPFSSGVTDEKVASLTVAWDMPLDGFQAQRAQALLAEDALTAALRRQAALRASLERSLRDLHRRFVQTQAGLALRVRRLEVERARLDAVLRRYEAGLVDNLEVTRTKQAVDTAELGLLDQRISLILLDAEYHTLLPVRPAKLDGP